MRHLILCGYKGCGKTTWGQKLALRTGRDFCDIDALHPTCLEVGERAFRANEQAATLLLSFSRPTVVATGGGTVVDPQNARHLRSLGTVIYLQADPGLLLARILAGPIPTFLDAADVEGSFWRHYEDRVPIYKAVSDVVVEGLSGQ